MRDGFSLQYRQTVAPNVEHFSIPVGDDENIDVEVWDLSGSDDFSELALAFDEFRNVDAFVLAYDITSLDSFEKLSPLHKIFVEGREKARGRRVRAFNRSKYGIQAKSGAFSANDVENSMKPVSSRDGTTMSQNIAATSTSLPDIPTDLFWSAVAVPFVLLGLKADFEQGREVDHEAAFSFCKKYSRIASEVRFFEASSRVPDEGANSFHVMHHIVSRALFSRKCFYALQKFISTGVLEREDNSYQNLPPAMSESRNLGFDAKAEKANGNKRGGCTGGDGCFIS